MQDLRDTELGRVYGEWEDLEDEERWEYALPPPFL